MVTVEQAKTAKGLLRERLGRPAWLRGIGIGLLPEGSFFVQVNVEQATPDVLQAIPDKVQGVQVRVEAVGKIRGL